MDSIYWKLTSLPEEEGEDKEIDHDFLSGALTVRDISYISMMEHELIDSQLIKKFEPVVQTMNHLFAYFLGTSEMLDEDISGNMMRWKLWNALLIRFWRIAPYRYEKKRKKVGHGLAADFKIRPMTLSHQIGLFQSVGKPAQRCIGRFWKETWAFRWWGQSSICTLDWGNSTAIDESLDLNKKHMSKEGFQLAALACVSLKRNVNVMGGFKVPDSTIDLSTANGKRADAEILGSNDNYIGGLRFQSAVTARHVLQRKVVEMDRNDLPKSTIGLSDDMGKRADPDFWIEDHMLLVLPVFQTVYSARRSVGRGNEITDQSSDSRSTIGLWVLVGERADAQSLNLKENEVGGLEFQSAVAARCLVKCGVVTKDQISVPDRTMGLSDAIGERADAQTQEIVGTLVGSPGPKSNLVARCP